ncbi:MFS transporter [Vulcanisaeta souniana]|uniref:MFS transporter n=1 Tax=Vulcanisaeta souniana JCM 11219 TaxID=1293586 RepID=A0A830EIM0_9CREN|nr:MFS transporter [Vulcanisaeta souniana]BDR91041.1 MFS transporter [Vulcanisaeta souniana JCM 11219]GGI80358.1 MFS transporter [Vulcanisaeta souniana JCM 11219]
MIGRVVESRANIVGGYLSWVMDSYDLGAVLVTAPVLGQLFFPRAGGSLTMLFDLLPIVFTVIFRPIGGLVFGYVGDKLGRRFSLLVTVLGYSLSIGLTGFLPTYEEIGVSATASLILLRSLQGIFIGGDVAGSFTISMESTPKLRGLFSGVLQSGVLLGFTLVSLVQSSLVALLGSSFTNYGWRIVFWLGMIPAALAIIIRLSMREPAVWLRRTHLNPMKALFPLPQVFLVTLGNWIMVYASSTFMPTFLATILGLPPRIYAPLLIIFNAVGIPAMMISGYASDLIGRRTTGVVASVMAIAGAAWFYATVNAHHLTTQLLIFGFFLNLPSAIIPAYLAERFRTHGRATGVGVGYNGPFIIAGWTSVLIAVLSVVFGPYMAALITFTIGAVLMIIGLLLGPETRDTPLY